MLTNNNIPEPSLLGALQASVVELRNMVQQLLDDKNSIGDWVTEAEVIRKTGLSKSSLFKMRKSGNITSSTLSGKSNWYRLSDFKKVLDKNEQER